MVSYIMTLIRITFTDTYGEKPRSGTNGGLYINVSIEFRIPAWRDILDTGTPLVFDIAPLKREELSWSTITYKRCEVFLKKINFLLV